MTTLRGRLRSLVRKARRGRPAVRLRARRGAMIVYLGVFFSTCVILGALTFDFGRLANLRAELQTSADAGALRGAVRMAYELCNGALATAAQASTYALMNKAMQGDVTPEAVEMGTWDGVGFDATVCSNAIRVRVGRASSGLFMSLLGVSPPTLHAEAIGYVCPPVSSECPTGPGPYGRGVLVR